MSLALLADNDALLCAAHWGLLELVPALVGQTWEHVSVLPQFPPRVARAEAKLFADPAVAQALDASLARRYSLPAPDADIVAALQGESQIDAGELVLVGVLGIVRGSFLLTGDKRALRAFAKEPVRTVLAPCHGRFICVEQLLWLALDVLGAEELTARVRRWPIRDKMALAIFGQTGAKSESHLREGLASYLRALRADIPGLLATHVGPPDDASPTAGPGATP